MFGKVFGFLGDSDEKALKPLRRLADEVNALEPEWERLSDDGLRAKTQEFRDALRQGDDLDDLLPEAFATVREAARRTIGQRHFDVQIMGGAALHQGKIAEMRTGEGKTLVATLPVYLNALAGQGVHVVTVNDYLARRDPQWMGPIYHLLGLSVGCLQHDASYLYDPDYAGGDTSPERMRPVTRREAYAADITYGTNNEFGFDYLRGNMVRSMEQRAQGALHYAIVDEVDNILIDEARTPLIISAPDRESTQLYANFAKLVPRLREDEDYTIDAKRRSVSITDSGIGKLEQWLNVRNLYDSENSIYIVHAENALRAKALYSRDREYVVRDGEVVIVDDFTGRLMPGRRLSDGLHQAIEAKEGVRVQRESITYASITLQNFFRLYGKLAGMTGTASTEAEELSKIYGLDVVVIPTHRPMVREDFPDFIYATEKAKFDAIATDLVELSKQGRPVLVGTVSIEKSEMLNEMLKRRGVTCQVLNAKQHEREAAIVAQAGRPGAVTVATNMAGRGTDIILGGNPASLSMTQEEWQADHDRVVELGGLHIMGTERHESRRIDDQLRGRSGRQGDPGSSRFYVSLEDEIVRRFGGDRVKGIMEWAGMGDDVPIENRVVSKALEASQSKVEGYNFEIRKNLVEYDEVTNEHRKMIYQERDKILQGADLKANIQEMVHGQLSSLVDSNMQGDESEDWELDALFAELSTIFPQGVELSPEETASMHQEEVRETLLEFADASYDRMESEHGADTIRALERQVMLDVIDFRWMRHMTVMENLRQGIGLEAFGQRNPLVMFKLRGREQFDDFLSNIQRDIVHAIYRIGLAAQTGPRRVAAPRPQTRLPQAAPGGAKVGRNSQCPCGSGKKYKRCHGVAA
ncbi:MAG: preprotein translocase subunit SecA [Chloroflexota bacterium]|nr:preprotein translocase subunit SecA [Chloroflexota bacterium]MDE2940798.1 preprotein translocase subunit SecA [Chloroflexota bacterium]MDE3268566.1 preprotein translocase subunit SecA [Chloroflexota bacterium]